MRWIVTGASGFIGTNLCIYLQRNGQEVFQLKAYPNELPKYAAIWKNIRPDVIVHLSADPLVKSSNTDSHFPLTLQLLNLIKDNKDCDHCPIFIYASSATLFGNCTSVKTEQDIVDPSSVYSVCKLSCEHLIELYTKRQVIQGISIRSVANVGKYSTHGILHDFVRKLKSDMPVFKLIGKEPGTIKPFIHIDDVCKILKFIVDKKLINSHINIAPLNPAPLSALQLANITMDEMNIHKPIEWVNETWEGDDNRLEISADTLIEQGFQWQYPDSISAVKGAIKDILNASS